MRIAMGQIRVDGGKPEANLDRAVEAIRCAAQGAADIVVLPECLDFGWTHPSARRLAQPIPGKHFRRLAAAAKKFSIFVVAGLVERDGDHLFNASVLINAEGKLLLKHRKIGELDIALALYTRGSSLQTTDIPFGRVAIPICADNQRDNLCIGHSLGGMDTKLILSPCAWAVDADHDNERNKYNVNWQANYCELSREYGMIVVGVSNVGPITAGPWKGRVTIGNSLAFAPGGTLARELPFGVNAETIEFVDFPESNQRPKTAG